LTDQPLITAIFLETPVKSIRMDQYFLIIGAMKSGTTSLFEYLQEHPAICAASVKEPEYFSGQQRHHDTRNRISSYAELWDFDPKRHSYAMEASTGYAKFEEPGVAQAIAAAGLVPKLVYIVRNPFDRIESQYNFMRRKPEWLHKITDPTLVQTSNYYRFAREYADVFGPERLLIVDFDELSADPLACVNRVCAFLNISPMTEIDDSAARNVTVPPKSGFERALRRAMPRNLSRSPIPLKTAVRRGLSLIRTEKSQLSAGQRQAVADALRDDMFRLRDEFGIDVARWGFDAS
jgi:Sulfotransferase family